MKSLASAGRHTGEENLMLAVLASAVKDYLNSPGLSGAVSKYGNKKNLSHRWLFEKDYDSVAYVFGFDYICTWFGLDPGKMRTAIKNIKTVAQAADVFEKARKKTVRQHIDF